MSIRYAKYVMLLAAFAFLVPFSAFARSRSEHTLVLDHAVLVGSSQLKPGTYKVEWQGNGPVLRVNIMEYGKTVATVQGKIVEAKTPWPDDEVVTIRTGKTQRLEKIDFGGKTASLVFVSNQTSGK